MALPNRTIQFENLGKSNLFVDPIYEGSSSGSPLTKLMGVGVQGGFRIVGSAVKNKIKLCVLYSSMSDLDWPDIIDFETGQLYCVDWKVSGKVEASENSFFAKDKS